MKVERVSISMPKSYTSAQKKTGIKSIPLIKKLRLILEIKNILRIGMINFTA